MQAAAGDRLGVRGHIVGQPELSELARTLSVWRNGRRQRAC